MAGGDQSGEGASVWRCLMMTMIGAAGTALGGLLVVIRPEMSIQELGLMQSFSAGLMLCLSCMELMPVSIGVLGFGAANFWFFFGAAFFAVIVTVIPEPKMDDMGELPGEEKRKVIGREEVAEALEATRPWGRVVRHRGGTVPAGVEVKGQEGSVTPPKDEALLRRRVMFSGLVTAIGIALHNLPEGVAVLLASLKSSQVGLSVALAIALHNVPEGVAVALPVYYATRSRWKGLLYAIAGGLAEPLAVLLFGGVFLPAAFDRVNPEVLEAVMASVGGIMAYLSLHELLPLALSHVSKRAAVHSLFVGMAVMSLNLYLLEGFTEGL